MIRVCRWALLAAIGACSGAPDAPIAGPAPAASDPVGDDGSHESPVGAPPGVAVTLADVGLEATSLDRTADPCVDFYQFACGGWIQNHQIPADLARWGRDSELLDRTAHVLRALLDADARGASGDAGAAQLGDFYAACLDDAAVERAGIAPLRPLLARTLSVRDPRSWLVALVELHRLGIPAVWSHRVRPDRKRSSVYASYLDAGELTLPDRAYYTSPALRPQLAGLERYAAALLGLLPAPPPRLEAAAADVVAIERALAGLADDEPDLATAYRPIAPTALARQVRSVDWAAYWKALGTAPSRPIVLGAPALFAGLDRLRAAFSPVQWSHYFTFRALAALAFALPRPYDDAAFELRRLLTGVEKPRDRRVRCVAATAAALGELLGPQYAAHNVSDGEIHAARELIGEMTTALGARLAAADGASAKLAKLARKVGAPDLAQSYDVAIRRDDFAGNALRVAELVARRERARAGALVERAEWPRQAFELGAIYEPTANALTVPAGALQPPYFALERSVAANLGGLALIAGHALSHAFDDIGARFDGDGNLADSAAAVSADISNASRCVAEQYATFEVLPGVLVSGAKTAREAVADLGGAELAFAAYRALRKDAVRPLVADGLSEDQQFFVAVAQAWCNRERPAETERRLLAEPTAPAKFRVYGALRNLPAFAEAFRCAAGTPMHPAERCRVWDR